MGTEKWYQELYISFGEKYEKEPYVQGTAGEVDFIERELEGNPEQRILDIGCGTGRHLLELARRGYSNLVGIDLSPSMLARAREKAEQENLAVDFIIMEACSIDYQEEFDAVLTICEGAFSLIEKDEMDFRILQNAARALKEKGQLIMTTPNALYALYHREEVGDFDFLTLRESFELEVRDDQGEKKVLNCNQRFYMPGEITWRLKSLGFERIDFFGGRLEKFSRENPLAPEDFEMLVVAEK